MISILGCSWPPLPPCLSSWSQMLSSCLVFFWQFGWVDAIWGLCRCNSLLPKQLQLMGFLTLAKKKTLFQHDFQVCLPLSPFYWMQFSHDFQVSLPLSPFYWIQFRHDFQVCLPLSSFYWIQFRHDFQVCLPLSPFYSIQFHHDFQVCLPCFPSIGSRFVMIPRFVPLLPLSPFYWILFRHAFQVCLPLSPLYWILFGHDFQVCLPLPPFYWIVFGHDFRVCLPLSPFYWILFRHDFQVCLPLSPFYCILFCHAFQFTDLDVVSLRFPSKFLVQGSTFIMVWRRVLLSSPLFLAGTWFEVKRVKLVRMWERLFGVDAGVTLTPVSRALSSMCWFQHMRLPTRCLDLTRCSGQTLGK